MPSEEDADKFRAYLKAQLTEVLTKFAPVDELWFDGGWERPVTWWKPKELEELIRGLAPNIVINDRLYERRRLRHARTVRAAASRSTGRGKPA